MLGKIGGRRRRGRQRMRWLDGITDSMDMFLSFRRTYQSLCKSSLLLFLNCWQVHEAPDFTFSSPQFFGSSKNSSSPLLDNVVWSNLHWWKDVTSDVFLVNRLRENLQPVLARIHNFKGIFINLWMRDEVKKRSLFKDWDVKKLQRQIFDEDFLVVQWLGLWAPNAEGLGLIPDEGTRSHMPQLKILHATTKT